MTAKRDSKSNPKKIGAKPQPQEKPKGRLKDLVAKAADKVRGGEGHCYDGDC